MKKNDVRRIHIVKLPCIVWYCRTLQNCAKYCMIGMHSKVLCGITQYCIRPAWVVIHEKPGSVVLAVFRSRAQ